MVAVYILTVDIKLTNKFRFCSVRSRNAIRRMNYLHSKYKNIRNADYLYVLAIFICEPIRFAEKYGYRSDFIYSLSNPVVVIDAVG